MLRKILASTLLIVTLASSTTSAEQIDIQPIGTLEYFYLPSCQPCKKQDIHLDEWIKKNKDALSSMKIEKINIKENLGDAIDRGFPIGLPNPPKINISASPEERVAQLKDEADYAVVRFDYYQGTPYMQIKDAEGNVKAHHMGVQSEKNLTNFLEKAFKNKTEISKNNDRQETTPHLVKTNQVAPTYYMPELPDINAYPASSSRTFSNLCPLWK